MRLMTVWLYELLDA